MISLSDAIERASLMSTDGSVNQESYKLLISELDEFDHHAFAMALVDRGLQVRTGNISIASKFKAVAQALTDDTEWWDPSTDINNNKIEEPVPEASDDIFGEVSQNIEILEQAGIKLDPEGKVQFYKSSLPGLFTDRLPQAMDIPRAITYYEQLLNSHDTEENKISGMLDLLSRITSQTQDIQNSLIEIENYKFNPNSKNENIKNIAVGLSNIVGYITGGNWNAAQKELESLKQLSDGYLDQRRERYDTDLNVIDALDRMMDMFEHNPEQFQQAVSGMGAIAKKSNSNIFLDIELKNAYAKEAFSRR